MSYQGTVINRVNKQIAIGCISPEARDLLDRTMEEWKKHKKQLPKTLMGKRYRPGVYSFAYWLIRWSGLVQPAAPIRAGGVRK